MNMMFSHSVRFNLHAIMVKTYPKHTDRDIPRGITIRLAKLMIFYAVLHLRNI